MFRRTALISTSALLLFGVLLTWSMAAVHSSDRNNYHHLVHTTQTQPPLEKHAPGLQYRRGVTKDLYLVDGPRRLHSHLSSPTSTVQFAFHYRNTQIEELMDEVEGDVQDDLFYKLPDGGEAVQIADGTFHRREGNHIGEALTYDKSWQRLQEIRHIRAVAAHYQFNTGRFNGNSVQLERFRAEGHTLAKAIKTEELMRGEASHVEFSANRRHIDFRARNLHAVIYSPQGVL